MVLKQKTGPRNKEHPIDATTQPPRPHPNRLRRPPPGGNNAGLILPATLALHLGLSQLVDRNHLDLGRAPRPSQHRRQDNDAGRLGAGGRRLHRRRRCVAHRQDGLRSRLRSQSAIHPGHLPAQLHLGPRPPAGRGEPRVAGPGLEGRPRTRRRAIHHRP